eukprot:1394171-Amorphochlora_amoeboformis.AAC.1
MIPRVCNPNLNIFASKRALSYAQISPHTSSGCPVHAPNLPKKSCESQSNLRVEPFLITFCDRIGAWRLDPRIVQRATTATRPKAHATRTSIDRESDMTERLEEGVGIGLYIIRRRFGPNWLGNRRDPVLARRGSGRGLGLGGVVNSRRDSEGFTVIGGYKRQNIVKIPK